ncbi:hypothetical protein [Candidatus Methanoperedens nitratireducens]|uniref:Uncharacterized protein n=1 Tax=Candidatus Methanoperedens nitratireducens TaxID=1392998 RepID=A0A284VKB7_9EURY|nr:hypothetical protein [Candidatus Methanoperedens nitroreducens]SNQ59714.1 conserved membrane hypothetical protein [Candidatus Methanoperedens nitroreducens]
MGTESELKDWPSSNYPIFLALVLLAATAVTLSVGDESRAESLAIYAYYFLVIGVAVRFFEFALPDSTLQRLGMAKKHILDRLKQHALKSANNQKIARMLKIPHFHQVKPEKILVPVADVSRDVSILLSVFLLISLIYGLMVDWWFVKMYIPNLVLIILGFLTLHFFTRTDSVE